MSIPQHREESVLADGPCLGSLVCLPALELVSMARMMHDTEDIGLSAFTSHRDQVTKQLWWLRLWAWHQGWTQPLRNSWWTLCLLSGSPLLGHDVDWNMPSGSQSRKSCWKGHLVPAAIQTWFPQSLPQLSKHGVCNGCLYSEMLFPDCTCHIQQESLYPWLCLSCRWSSEGTDPNAISQYPTQKANSSPCLVKGHQLPLQWTENIRKKKKSIKPSNSEWGSGDSDWPRSPWRNTHMCPGSDGYGCIYIPELFNSSHIFPS